MPTSKFSFNQVIVKHIADLAHLPVDETETTKLTQAFNETLEIINSLQELDLDQVEPTHHTTDLVNILRRDRVDRDNMFTQEQALASAKKTYQGYFVVPQVIKNKKA